MVSGSKRVSKVLFEEVLKKGQTVNGPLFSVRILPNHPLKINQYAVVSPKAVSKKAVDRNYMRRKGYALLREFDKNLIKPFVFIVFFKKEASKVTFSALKEEFSLFLKKNKLIK